MCIISIFTCILLTDYEPVINQDVNAEDHLVSFTLMAIDDTILFEEDIVTLTFVSAYQDFVKQVEMQGEFVRSVAVVTIIDNDS